MKNLTEYNDFKNKKHESSGDSEPVVNEGAQLFDDNTWKVRMRVEIPTALINSYIKKVKDETGEDPRRKWSDQELAEELAKHVTTSYMTIENLPVSIITSMSSEPKAQAQESMPVQTQVQAQVEPGTEPQSQAAPAPQAQGAPASQGAPSAQAIATKVPQGEGTTAQI